MILIRVLPMGLLLIAGALVIQVQAKQRYNAFEPLFGDDQSDAHTISLGSHRPQDLADRTAPNRNSQKRTPKLQLPPIAENQKLTSKIPQLASPSTTSRQLTTPEEPKKPSSTAKRQVIISSAVQQTEPVVQQVIVESPASHRSAETPKPEHWVALKKYYEKLRASYYQQYPLLDNEGQGYEVISSPNNPPEVTRHYETISPSDPPVALPSSPFSFPHGGNSKFETKPGWQNIKKLEPVFPERSNFPPSPSNFRPLTRDILNREMMLLKKQEEFLAPFMGPESHIAILEEQYENFACGLRNSLMSESLSSTLMSPGEYPSHAGLYNGSALNDQDYICAASLVHARFALTLASCINNLTTENLFVRLGEWHLNKTMNEDQRQLGSLSPNRVARVHRFPGYQANTSEHNLALLEWLQPVNFYTNNHVAPACQLKSRSSLKARYCWAPVRTILESTFFDPEGDGETKVRRYVQMADKPIKLVPEDDTECLKQTFVQHFNFHNPNYICSADSKRVPWRSQLNRGEYFGSGIYCNEGGLLHLVSMLHPMRDNTPSASGYLDLSYYRPWIKNTISLSQQQARNLMNVPRH